MTKPVRVTIRCSDHTVGVLGLGVAGLAAARFLRGEGARLVLVDTKTAAIERLQAEFQGARIACGPHVAADVFAGCTAVLKSPGVDPNVPQLVAARAAHIPIWGELTLLAAVAQPLRTLVISGTNGKSTTTALTGALVQALGQKAFVGGNLGLPIGDWLAMPERPTDGVLELSSYQIDTAWDYVPDVAVMLNVTPDHLARYKTLQAYQASKARLIASVGPNGTAILNADDPVVRAMAGSCPGRVLWVSTQPSLDAAATEARGAPLSGLVLRDEMAQPVGALCRVMGPVPLTHAGLIGVHNRQNALAALLASYAFLPWPEAERAERTAALTACYQQFAGLPHRLARVGMVDQVLYLNDSKATNDASAATAVDAMQVPYVLLVGGQDKGGGYQALIAALGRRPPRAIVCFGAACELLMASLAPTGVPMHGAATLEQACQTAQGLAQPGDTVLLSPACTSFDAYANYMARGDAFVAWVARAGADCLGEKR